MSRKSFDKEIMGKTCGFKRWDFTSRDTANWTKWEMGQNKGRLSDFWDSTGPDNVRTQREGRHL